MSLFRRTVTVCSLSSGSAGNCTYVGDGHAGVLIDCGSSTKKILEAMREMGLADAPMDGVLITHEHSDHVGAAAVLSRNLSKKGKPVPFYMTGGTYEGTPPAARPDGFERIEAGKSFRLRHLLVEPIPVPHDAKDPVAYRIQIGDASVGIITDLGKPTKLVAQHMLACDVLFLEFNHDEQLLMDGPYPYVLKQRIRGNHGHLSNRQAAELLETGLGDRLKHLFLSHLSDENNRPDIAYSVAVKAVAGRLPQENIRLTRQRMPIAPVSFETRDW